MSNEQRTPEFSDADLLAYLDGELEEGLAREVAQSANAERRLRELAQQEHILAARLYRADCPEAHDLGEYLLQSMAAERAALVAQHVEICPHCAMELNELRDTMRELAGDLETPFIERLRVLVGRLVPDIQLPSFGSGTAPMPALAGMRGEMEGPLLYEAGEVQVSLEVQDDATGAEGSTGRKSVLGLVTGAEVTGWQATLWLEDGPVAELVQTLKVDELGNFVFDGLHPGTYALTLRGDEVEVVIQDLAVS